MVIGIGFSSSLGWTVLPVSRGRRPIDSLRDAGAGAFGAVQTVRTWSADLVAGRRRMRLAIVTSSLLFIGLSAVSHLMWTRRAIPGVFGSLPSALGLLAMAALVGWSLFYPPPADRGRRDGAGCLVPATFRPCRVPMAAGMPSHPSCCVASTG